MTTKTTFTLYGEIQWQGIGRFRIMLIDSRGNYVFRRADALGSCYMTPGDAYFDYQGWVKVRGKQIYIAKERVTGPGLLLPSNATL